MTYGAMFIGASIWLFYLWATFIPPTIVDFRPTAFQVKADKGRNAESWKLDRLVPLLGLESLEAFDANLPAIIVDPSAESNYSELIKAARRLENPVCNGGYHFLEHPTTVGDFVGGKVKTIRVLRTAPFRRFAKPPTQDETREKLKRVWQGKFQQFSCQIDWAERTLWSIEAAVEFEDGKRTSLITDSVHVALQDHNGNSAFFRLFPAAQ